MKLIQLNLWQGRITRQAVRFAKEQDADIMCVQEAYSSPEPLDVGYDAYDCFDRIQREVGYEHSFYAPLYSFNVGPLRTTYGNGILSKFPLSQTDHMFTNGKYIADTAAEDVTPNTRNIQKCIVDTPAGPLNLVNYHAHWEITPEGSATSVERMEKAVEFIGDPKGPFIMAGDLNVNPGTPAMRPLKKYGESLTEKHNPESTMSPLAIYYPVKPDHIIVSDEITVDSFEVSKEIVSDHAALILEFNL